MQTQRKRDIHGGDVASLRVRDEKYEGGRHAFLPLPAADSDSAALAEVVCEGGEGGSAEEAVDSGGGRGEVVFAEGGDILD